MIKKWIKLLVVVSIIATVIATCSANRNSDTPSPVGTITLTIDYEKTLWEYVEAMREDTTVIGLLYTPDPCVIQIAKSESETAGEIYHLQVKNCDTEEIVLNIDVTKENIDDAWNSIVEAADFFKETASTFESGKKTAEDLLGSIQDALETAKRKGSLMPIELYPHNKVTYRKNREELQSRIMTQKEISELRRHIRRDRSNMVALHGCFVNDKKEIISKFRLPVGTMPENEADQFFALMKKSLSGTQGKNLIDIAFRTSQVANGPEHKLLMDLRGTQLKDENILHQFFQRVVDSVELDSSYLILLGCDTYDVPFKNRASISDSDCSEESYCFLLCCICPVKQSKPTIEYKAPEKEFHNSAIAQLLTSPALGFLFPAFDNRCTNIYNALLYTKDANRSHEEFVTAIFNTEPFIPAAVQKQSFDDIMANALGDECSMDVVQAVCQDLDQRILLHKESRIDEPLTVSKEEIQSVLTASGVSEEKVAKFGLDYETVFGFDAQIPPKNIAGQKHFEVKTPDVTIRVNPDRSDLIETRVIGGVKYILVCADEDVEVNGIKINIDEKDGA